MRMACFFRALAILFVALAAACTVETTAEDVLDKLNDDLPIDPKITLKATLETGAVALTQLAPPAYSQMSALADHSLYCVTFTTPATAGTAKADAAGAVSLTLASRGASLGCFITDAAGKNMATVVFESGSARGLAAAFSADADFGTITVDAEGGLALATLPASGSLANAKSSGAACPYGQWKGSVAQTTCGGAPMNMSLLVAPGANGGTELAMVVGPVPMGNDGQCSTFNSAAESLKSDSGHVFTKKYENGSLIFEYTAPATQCSHTYGFKLTPSATCATGAGAGWATNCASCDNQCTGCGSITCESSSGASEFTRY